MVFLLAAEDTIPSFLQGVREGWSPEESCCSGESKEMLACMTWVGRKSAKKLTDRIRTNVDRGLKSSIALL